MNASKGTLLFAAALAAGTGAVGLDHAANGVPERAPSVVEAAAPSAGAPCAAGSITLAPCAAAAPSPTGLRPPPPPPAPEPQRAAPPPPPAPLPEGSQEAPDLALPTNTGS